MDIYSRDVRSENAVQINSSLLGKIENEKFTRDIHQKL